GPKRPTRRSDTPSPSRESARSRSGRSTTTGRTWTPTASRPQAKRRRCHDPGRCAKLRPVRDAGVRIRLARAEDLPELQRIEREAGTRFRGMGLLDHLLDRTLSLSELAQHQRADRIWIADGQDGRPLGFAVANVLDGLAHLEELDVVPDAGGRGVGPGRGATGGAWGGGGGSSVRSRS